MKKLSNTKRNKGLLMALDNAKDVLKEFDPRDNPLRNKKARAWLKRIGNA
jgi:hypothetical protein